MIEMLLSLACETNSQAHCQRMHFLGSTIDLIFALSNLIQLNAQSNGKRLTKVKLQSF